MKIFLVILVFVVFSGNLFASTISDSTEKDKAIQKTKIEFDSIKSNSEIKSDKLSNERGGNISDKMQGETAGLNTRSSSDPQQSLEMLIRGKHSISLDNNPLFVVDGIIMNAINTIQDLEMVVNPNDVDRIEILKDAYSTNRYGSRGANGVIVITTKTGKR